MAAAIKQVSVQRGYDLRGYVLACFGGAGGQHACRVAQALGIERVMIHRLAGVLSAYGMGLADLRVLREVTVETPLDADPTALSIRAGRPGRRRRGGLASPGPSACQDRGGAPGAA